ncbi:MAG: cytochrome c3 family protein [Phycisphaerae bacterium]
MNTMLLTALVLTTFAGQLSPLLHEGALTVDLRSPARVAIAPDGTVLVTDPFYNHIARFDAADAPLGTWPVAEGPIGVAAHPDGRYFVTLRDLPGVAIYDASFTRTGFLGENNPLVSWAKPTDVEVDSTSGRIYVVDGEGDRVYGFESDGTLALIIGMRGTFPGQFRYPSAIAVDAPRSRLLVGDHDNFRIEVFGTAGLFQFRFGYRMKYVGMNQEGWMPRTLGLAVDDTGHIYVADALMSTVRVFDTGGSELGKVVTYGTAPGDLRTPCDLALSPDGTRLYVVNTNASQVEIYTTPAWGPVGWTGKKALPDGMTSATPDVEATSRSCVRNGLVGTGLFDRWPTPAAGFIAPAFAVGVPRPLGGDGPGFGEPWGPRTVFDGPHMIEEPDICNRCHGITGQPGQHPGLVEGQTALCLSCHTAGGQALDRPLYERDIADPYGTNPGASDGRGRSHAWGVAAVSADADSVGPPLGNPMADYLDAAGNIKCSTCHDQHSAAAGTPYLRVNNTGDAMCKACHAPRDKGLFADDPVNNRGTHPVGFVYPGGTGEFPDAASVSPLLIAAGKVECRTCHAVHGADSGGANAGEGDGMLLRAANDETLCQICHTNHVGHTPSGPWQPTCLDCHDTHDPSNMNLALIASSVLNQTLGQLMPVVFTATTGANSFDDGDPAVNDGICQVCHTSTTYHRYDGSGVPHNDGADCTSCHPHDSGFLPVGGSSCIACHSSPQGPRPAVVNPDGSGGHHLLGGVLTDADCVECHDTSQHQGGTVRLWTDPANPGGASFGVDGTAVQLDSFCAACHDGMTHPTIHTPQSAWNPSCTECHELHDPANANLSLVRDSVHNQTLVQDFPVVFTSTTGANSFDDGDPAVNDGICQVCHTSTTYHRYDGSGVPHNDGADCTACHPHPDGFMPTAGSCSDCHATAQGGRRPVVGEFALASHHLQGTLLDDADCVVCHEMTQHQQGQVRLFDVDNPATVITLNGDPTTTPAEALKLEAFCLACHDANGAGGAAPFTDGIMPMPIDPAVWAAASHKLGGAAGQMTCFGDGETTGCHGTGHGSAKRKLLAPADASQPPVAGDPLREEEGMCYTCHDSDGPAAADIQSQFALANHHNVSAVDQTDGSRVECTDCHDPHAAASAALLKNPDTGAAWTGSGVDFCLVCHDGSPPAGVAFPAGSSGTGYDKSAFVGTTHASSLGADACRQCHENHGSAYRSMLLNEYVITDNNTYAEADYATCWICHDANTIVFGNNQFENLHKKHVQGQKAPCIICHDTHAGFDAGEPGLINFDFAVQDGGYNITYHTGFDASTAFWVNGAQDRGFCDIRCHGKDHNPKNYNRTP